MYKLKKTISCKSMSNYIKLKRNIIKQPLILKPGIIKQDTVYADFNRIDLVKNKINHINQQDWVRVRKHSNTYEAPCCDKKIVSRAFYKLWEIIQDYSVCSNSESLHLCEAPGGFVQATLEYKKFRFKEIKKCHTISLERKNNLDIPKYHDSIVKNKNVNIIKKNDGDLYDLRTILYLYTLFDKRCIKFITADGGITENGDFNHKEKIHARLIMSQVFTCFLILEDKGDFVLKIFDIFTKISVDIIYLLTCVFEDVYITKPLTSRPTNSEKYIVCKGYIRKNFTTQIKNTLFKCLVNLNVCSIFKELPECFINTIKLYNETFISQQIKYIEENLFLLKDKKNNFYDLINKKKVYGKNWSIKYRLQTITDVGCSSRLS